MSNKRTKIDTTKPLKEKIKQSDRLCDTANIKLRDILLKDLLTESDMKTYYAEDKANILRQMDIFIDKEEEDPLVSFNFSVDNEPASIVCSAYHMFTLSGKNNESGSDPLKIIGEVLQSEPDTIVKFKIPNSEDTFSQHKDGISYANYVIYGITDKSKIVLSKGKIYMTDILYDLTENILDGQ